MWKDSSFFCSSTRHYLLYKVRNMQNAQGQYVDLYVPRKCSWTNRLIHATDHAAVTVCLPLTIVSLLHWRQYFCSRLQSVSRFIPTILFLLCTVVIIDWHCKRRPKQRNVHLREHHLLLEWLHSFKGMYIRTLGLSLHCCFLCSMISLEHEEELLQIYVSLFFYRVRVMLPLMRLPSGQAFFLRNKVDSELIKH